jgi:integrase
MAKVWTGKWAGGRIALLKSGKRRWVLERRWQGRQHTIPLLKVRDEEGAAAALYAWTGDPAGFIDRHLDKQRRDRGAVTGAVLLTVADLAALTVDQTRRHLSPRYIHSTKKHGVEWLAAFRGVDLRGVSRAEVHAVLNKLGGNQLKRILAIKAICAYLVKQGRLDPALSPARFVRMPVVVPERSVRSKGYSPDTLAAIYSHIVSQDVRDAFRLQCFTGMHGTEVARIAASGLADALGVAPQARLTRLAPADDGYGTAIAGTVTVWHKRGSPHTISLDAPAFGAALRLQRLGKAPRQDRMWRQLKAASKLAGVVQVRAGELRHSLVSIGQRGTWTYPTGVGIGVDELATVTGHRSSSVTRRFYDNQAVPRMLLLPLQLTHPADPALSVAA